MANNANDLAFKKLHPSSPFFMLLDTIKEFFLIIIFAVFASSQAETWQLWAIGVSSVFVLFRMIGIRFFSYAIDKEELVVKQGIFFKQVRNIPFERVQNINETQGIFHRFFKVSKASLESASGQKPEAVFNVIAKQALEDIRAAVISKRFAQRDQSIIANAATVNSENEKLFFMPSGEVMLHGLVTLKGLIPIAIVWGLLAQQEALWDKLFTNWFSKIALAANINSEVLAASPAVFIASLFGLIVFGLLCFCVLSILYSIFKFYDFTLERQEEKLLAKRGLLTKRTSSSSIQRIQKITLYESVLHRLCKRMTISCKTAGNSAQGDGGTKFDALAPLITQHEAKQLLKKVFPELSWVYLKQDSAEWSPIPFRSWIRAVKWKIFFSILFCLFLAIWLKHWALAVFITASMWSIYSARREAKYAAYIYHNDYMVYRSDWINKTISVVPLQKAHALELKQNIFDKRHAMAAFEIDTAGVSFLEHGIDIRYMEYKEAQRIYSQVIQRTNQLDFQW